MSLHLSKTTKLVLLLTIDILFFLVELTVGFGVHSLALVADAFHMFNDVLSLLVGLWAIRVATGREATNVYTYGVCSPPAVYKIVTKLRRHNYSGNALRRLVH